MSREKSIYCERSSEPAAAGNIEFKDDRDGLGPGDVLGIL